MLSIKQLLIAARALIEKPEHWTQEVHARDSAGNKVSPNSSKAVCFCAHGALVRVFNKTYGLEEEKATAYLKKQTGTAIWTFNDSHTHEEVLNVFDKAIASAS